MTAKISAPPIRDFESLTMPDCTIVDLMPGMKLHLLNNGTQEANRISVVLRKNFADRKIACASSILPSLLQEGCVTMSGAEIAETIDFNGAWLSTLTPAHYWGLALISLNETTEQLLPVIGDMILRPTFPEKSIENARRKSAMMKRLNLSKPQFIANTELERRIYGPSHPYLGNFTPEEIEAITRDDIINAHKYSLDTEIHIFAAGKLTDNILKSIENLARQLCPTNSLPSEPLIHFQPEAAATINIHSRFAIEQAAVACGIPTIRRDHPDYNDLRHTIVAFGGYFGSRLMTNIREDKGLTYGINATLQGMLEGSHICINAQCDNSYVEQVVAEIKNEMHILADTEMGADELHRVKSEITSGLAARLESPFSIIDYYESNLLIGIPDGYFQHQFETVRALTPAKICEMATKYLVSENMTTVTVSAPARNENPRQ